MSYQTVFDELNRNLEDRLKRYQKEVKIDGSAQITGQISNNNLAPINLGTPALTINQLSLGKGGTGADLSGSLAGVFQILNDGDSAATVALLDSGLIDWNNHPGSPLIGTPLVYTGSGLGAAFQQLNLSSLTGTLAANHGGTGQASYAVGDLLYASGTTTLSKLADVATGNALISGGVTTAPSWGKIGLTTHVSGILAGTNGGTGVNNGSNALTVPASGTAALLGVSNQAFTENNSFAKILRARNTSGTNGYGLRIWDGTDDWGNLQALDLSGNSFLFFSLNRYYDGSAWQQFNTRVGCSFQLTNDGFNFYSFAANSNTAVSRLGVTGAGVTTINLGDAATNAASNLLVLQHNSSGTPAAGFGSTILTRLASSTTDDQSAATDIVTWATATHASRKARRVFNIYDTAAREALRIEASGTAAMIGFLGAAAVARPTVTGSRGGNAALASLLTQLATLGLITDSSS